MKFIHFDQFEFDSWASEEILSCATANKTQFNTIDKFLSECPSDKYREEMLAYCEEKSWIDYEKMDKTRAPHIKYLLNRFKFYKEPLPDDRLIVLIDNSWYTYEIVIFNDTDYCWLSWYTSA
jgi:hypothetical protein